MGKYDPLRAVLSASRARREMSFGEIADLVGGLPDSAYNHRAWWANEVRGRHVEARAWLDAGMRVETVDLAAKRVRFPPN